MALFTRRDVAKLFDLTLPAVNNMIRKLLVDDEQLGVPAQGDKSGIKYLHPSVVAAFLKYKGYSFETDKILSFQVLKGGTGKSSLSSLVAARMAAMGFKILLIDADPQGNATDTMRKRLEVMEANEGLEPLFKETLDVLSNEKKGHTWIDFVKDRKLQLSDIVLPVTTNLDLIKSRFSLARLDREILNEPYRYEDICLNKIRPKGGDGKIAGGYSFVIFDCPPSLSPFVASIYISSDKIILPVRPDLFSLSALEETLDEYARLAIKYDKNPEINLLINAFDRRVKINLDAVGDIQREFAHHRIYPVPIRQSSDIPSAIFAGRTVWETDRKSAVGEDIDTLVLGIINLTEAKATNSRLIKHKKQTHGDNELNQSF